MENEEPTIYHGQPEVLSKLIHTVSGVARAFPGGRVAQPEGQNEEENEQSLRKNTQKLITTWGKMRKVELLATRDFEAGYGHGSGLG